AGPGSEEELPRAGLERRAAISSPTSSDPPTSIRASGTKLSLPERLHAVELLGDGGARALGVAESILRCKARTIWVIFTSVPHSANRKSSLQGPLLQVAGLGQTGRPPRCSVRRGDALVD